MKLIARAGSPGAGHEPRAALPSRFTDHITPRSGVARQVGRQAIISLERSDGRWTIVDVCYVG